LATSVARPCVFHPGLCLLAPRVQWTCASVPSSRSARSSACTRAAPPSTCCRRHCHRSTAIPSSHPTLPPPPRPPRPRRPLRHLRRRRPHSLPRPKMSLLTRSPSPTSRRLFPSHLGHQQQPRRGYNIPARFPFPNRRLFLQQPLPRLAAWALPRGVRHRPYTRAATMLPLCRPRPHRAPAPPSPRSYRKPALSLLMQPAKQAFRTRPFLHAAETPRVARSRSHHRSH